MLDELPRDVNWLLTLQCVLEAALAVGDREVVETAARLLTPYEDRAVINAGAVMFHGVTDDTLARAAAVLGDPATATRLRNRALATYERIGAQWWRDRLAAWQPRATDAATLASPHAGAPASDRRAASGWSGPKAATAPLRALRGFGYLRELLRRPGRPIAALDLVGAGAGVVAESGLGDLLDKQALTAYRQRLRDLDQELTEAEDWADLGRLDTLHAERDALLDELARATGLNGRTRTTGSSQERARSPCRKPSPQRSTASPPSTSHSPGTCESSIHTGLNCSYEPDRPDELRWTLDQTEAASGSDADQEHLPS